MDTPANIPAWLRRNALERGSEPAIFICRQGSFQPTCWTDLSRDVGRLLLAFERFGLRPGDRVVQIAENSYQWIVTDLAILAGRFVHVPLHASLANEQLAPQVVNCEASLAFVADQERIEPLAAQMGNSSQPRFISQDEAFSSFCADIADHEALAAITRQVAIGPDDLATIMYTSGTSGDAKGVMLSHGNLASNAWATAERYEREPDELRLCFLPLTHIYARTCDMYTWVYHGSQLALAQSRETVMADCAAVAPTNLNGVPYFYEKVCRKLRESGKADEPGLLKKTLGGRIRVCFSGGAALAEHVEAYFAQQEVPLLQGYGLTESSPVISASGMTAYRPGCVGKPLSGVTVQIAPDGEILTQGPHVMLGYWNDPESTARVLHDGWLHTGDLGQIDAEGFLRITGRKKEMIVTSTGKNIAPAHLESLLLESPYILQAMVIGDGRSHLAAILVPEPDQLRQFIRRNRLWVFSRKMAVRHRRVRQLFRQEIDRLLAGLSRHQQIGPFEILDRGFTIESGELTPKASLRRNVIAKNLADRIERLYRQ